MGQTILLWCTISILWLFSSVLWWHRPAIKLPMARGYAMESCPSEVYGLWWCFNDDGGFDWTYLLGNTPGPLKKFREEEFDNLREYSDIRELKECDKSLACLLVVLQYLEEWKVGMSSIRKIKVDELIPTLREVTSLRKMMTSSFNFVTSLATVSSKFSSSPADQSTSRLFSGHLRQPLGFQIDTYVEKLTYSEVYIIFPLPMTLVTYDSV
ncbi:hypothetical protein DVH24_041504 [Malus domestica]|uniref:Uncharacterized protein n=1 Tax=Malus domestica TaxID=3750 RepID=A0A498IEG9_MALDO|nr:hypothetical protein DVH24_041504 [Malus domestica]